MHGLGQLRAGFTHRVEHVSRQVDEQRLAAVRAVRIGVTRSRRREDDRAARAIDLVAAAALDVTAGEHEIDRRRVVFVLRDVMLRRIAVVRDAERPDITPQDVKRGGVVVFGRSGSGHRGEYTRAAQRLDYAAAHSFAIRTSSSMSNGFASRRQMRWRNSQLMRRGEAVVTTTRRRYFGWVRER